MIYTARFAHLAARPGLAVGDTVTRGQIIGIMGSSGDSEAPHVHLDGVKGEQAGAYTQADIEAGKPEAAPPRQLLYFADAELFGVEPVCTTPYAELEYFQKRGKVHLGLDLVPNDRHATCDHFAIHWPRSMPGRVVRVAYDPDGYGHHVCIAYEAKA